MNIGLVFCCRWKMNSFMLVVSLKLCTCMPHFILVLVLTSGREVYYTLPILVLFLVLRAVFDATSPMWRMDLPSMAMLRK